MPDREFDVVLYGATGFTGRQTVQYFAQYAPRDLRWAIAGRNRTKLDALLGTLKLNVPVRVAGSADQNAIDSLISRTRVALSTAGPFALYGNGIVDACVRCQTHYVDITGETHWVKTLIDKYHETAAAEGTRIIPFCGFDSVPSDLGAMLVAGALGPEVNQVKAFFQMAGGLNGGTLASAINMYESGATDAVRSPFLLSTARVPRALERDPVTASYDSDIKSWVAPFVMGVINTRVVRRSCELLGAEFDYQEYMKFEGSMAAMSAFAAASAGAVFGSSMQLGPVRGLLRMLAPAPGAGPSEQTMNSGWFRCEFLGHASDGRTAQVLIADKGDPGNRITVKCVCESALALALDPVLPGRGGVLTPATGIGDALVARLRSRGMTIDAG
jgi:short subunit dehydrogenase-like uncharacterized protein